MHLKIVSLNAQDMGELVREGPELPKNNGNKPEHFWRAHKLGALIKKLDADIVGIVEAPASEDRTSAFVCEYLDDAYKVYQGERRGVLSLAFLVKKSFAFEVDIKSKEESLKDFHLGPFDADGDGIREVYSWYNRVPFEITLSGGGLAGPTTLILIHAKSKGAFVPGDLYHYERVSRANRMKLRAQAAAIRKRLDALVSPQGEGRVIVMGDMNDGPEFDIHATILGGAFLEHVMGSIWDPTRVFYNTHADYTSEDRWTIDFSDRVLNPIEKSKYGNPTEMRSWIDHILVSPELKSCILPESAGIVHDEPSVSNAPIEFQELRATDHHPPFIVIDL